MPEWPNPVVAAGSSTCRPMSSRFEEIWNVERSQGLRRLTGSRVSGVVPIRQALVDRVLARWRRSALLEDLHVRLLASRRLHVSAHVRIFGFRKHVDATLKLPPAVDFHGRPSLRLEFVERSALALAASFAGPLLGRLPAGISLTDSAVTLDLPELLARTGAADLLPHAKALAFETEDGVVWLNVEIEIAPTAGNVSPAWRTPTAIARRDSGAVDMIPMLAGTRLAVDVRAHESLVTEIVSAALTDAAERGDAPSSTGGALMTEFFAPPRLRFEPETMVLETELRIDHATT